MIKEIALCYLLNKKELENLYFYLIKNNGYVIKYIENPTEEMQLEAVKKDGYYIQYIKNPSIKVLNM